MSQLASLIWAAARNTVTWLCRAAGAHVTGVDLSGVRIDNAVESLNDVPELASRLEFHKASATDLPFADGAFSHVWSQATIHRIPDKITTLNEAYRVLEQGGVMAFDDLTKPRPDISDEARAFVYDRLLFDTDFSFCSYMDALRETGFQVLEARDLSAHFASSYSCLSQMAARPQGELRRTVRRLSHDGEGGTKRGAGLSPVPLRQVGATKISLD